MRGGGGAGAINPFLLQGFTVDSSGYIEFPNIGRIQIGGLTLEGVRDKIDTALRPYLPNAAVNVKFLNFRYSILGDIMQPGTYTTINERVSILEAIATAGDFTPYAERDQVLLIREGDGQRIVTKLDLQDEDIFTSPYYYLQQNDVIYIEPTQAKVATVADPLTRAISYGTAFLSVITFALTVFGNNQ
jgi:polysaccharide export outer membrane protein